MTAFIRTIRSTSFMRLGRRALQTKAARPAPFFPDRLLGEILSTKQEQSIKVCSEKENATKVHIPKDCHMKTQIGNTDLIEIEPQIYAKLEGGNLGGSNKDRALIAIIYGMYVDGRIRDGDTLCLVTSGSAALSLFRLKEMLTAHLGGTSFNVIACLPAMYLKNTIVKNTVAYCHEHDIPVHGENDAEDYAAVLDQSTSPAEMQLLLMQNSFVEILASVREKCEENGWLLIDQHYDEHAPMGHKITGYEIQEEFARMQEDLHHVVAPTGTGATIAGIQSSLPPQVKVHSRKSVPGMINGLADVNRYDNYCDSDEICGYNAHDAFDKETAMHFQEKLQTEHGLECGLSTGASYWLARQIKKRNAQNGGMRENIVFLAPDGKRKMTTSTSGQRSTRKDTNVKAYDNIIVGAGPVGASTAMFLSEGGDEAAKSRSLWISDESDAGAHEDWSKILRLSWDSSYDEFTFSQRCYELIEMLNEIRASRAGHDVISMQPGVLFVASPKTSLAENCLASLHDGRSREEEEPFRLYTVQELNALCGNMFNLPDDTLCFWHPKAACVNPLELVRTMTSLAKQNGLEHRDDRVQHVAYDRDSDRVLLTGKDGACFSAKKLYMFAGAQNKQILNGADNIEVPELDDTYITGISTIRYPHRLSVDQCALNPIIVGQLDVDDASIMDFQANFSIIPESGFEAEPVLKTRLSGRNGTEVVDTVQGRYSDELMNQNAAMTTMSQQLFGRFFPYIEATTPLDFNRCCTYRNHSTRFNKTSLLNVPLSDATSILTTTGCYGVGVKFGPSLGEAAVAFNNGDACEGVQVVESTKQQSGRDRKDKTFQAF